MNRIKENLKNKISILNEIEASRNKISNKGLYKLDKFIRDIKDNLSNEIKTFKTMKKKLNLSLLKDLSYYNLEYKGLDEAYNLIDLIKEEFEIMQDLILKFDKENKKSQKEIIKIFESLKG